MLALIAILLGVIIIQLWRLERRIDNRYEAIRHIAISARMIARHMKAVPRHWDEGSDWAIDAPDDSTAADDDLDEV